MFGAAFSRVVAQTLKQRCFQQRRDEAEAARQKTPAAAAAPAWPSAWSSDSAPGMVHIQLPSTYGRAGVSSEKRARAEEHGRERARPVSKRKCAHSVYTERMLAPQFLQARAMSWSRRGHVAVTSRSRRGHVAVIILQSFIMEGHTCKHTWMDDGEEVQCHHRLWAASAPGALKALADRREKLKHSIIGHISLA